MESRGLNFAVVVRRQRSFRRDRRWQIQIWTSGGKSCWVRLRSSSRRREVGAFGEFGSSGRILEVGIVRHLLIVSSTTVSTAAREPVTQTNLFNSHANCHSEKVELS